MAKNSLWNLPSKKITANFRNKSLHYGLYLLRKEYLKNFHPLKPNETPVFIGLLKG